MAVDGRVPFNHRPPAEGRAAPDDRVPHDDRVLHDDRVFPGDFVPPGEGPGTAGEVFRTALGLGLTSFGGPIAHLGFFRREYVARRRWLDESAFADLVALCQF